MEIIYEGIKMNFEVLLNKKKVLLMDIFKHSLVLCYLFIVTMKIARYHFVYWSSCNEATNL